jgi:hypothetical protein
MAGLYGTPIWLPPDTCGHGALEMWLVQLKKLNFLLKLKCDHIGQHRSAKDEGKLLQAKDGGQKCASV